MKVATFHSAFIAVAYSKGKEIQAH